MPDIGIVGATGRLGERLAREADRYGANVTLTASASSWCSSRKPDVLIDVSRPSAVDKVVKYCAERKVPLLTAVSGYEPEQRKLLQQLAEQVGVLHVDNLSGGHRVQRELVRMLPELRSWLGTTSSLGIVEQHPAYKQDRPSGTALALRKLIQDGSEDQVSIDSVRAGVPVCRHEVILGTDDEEVVVSHHVRDWSAYTGAALRMALWLSKCTAPSMYTVEDFYTFQEQK
ncbi:dihydrodipicolinate reductase C-terminal domain-containing protein [Rhodococcoides fascians]|uniref:dihydrodipicolinate reductase C-terminal domain-containing protein n=1 Tax=Rhodococcoides fascians TaxID=1828 RepID=UPI001DA53DA0|nr:4-hydroxy-tetrahydrodipicolinate reductase [Rhodococcus fascians]